MRVLVEGGLHDTWPLFMKKVGMEGQVRIEKRYESRTGCIIN